MTQQTIANAGRDLAAVFGDGYVALDVGGSFTCGEAELIAGALVSLGQVDAAAAWLAGHASQDDHGDQHWFITHVVDGNDEWSGLEPERPAGEREEVARAYVLRRW